MERVHASKLTRRRRPALTQRRGSRATPLDDFYRGLEPAADELPPGLDGALRSLFGDLLANRVPPIGSRLAGKLL